MELQLKNSQAVLEMKETTPVDVSVVMPCLNEAETLPSCIGKAWKAIGESNLRGEVIVADNGSTDGSPEIAARMKAQVVHVAEAGYGNALRGGIGAARGQYIVMGDADDSYDFSRIQPFILKLREGYDLVMGNRFTGDIAAGAMPALHRWFGNPLFTRIAHILFRTPIGDIYCGLRAFSKLAYDRMGLRATGMEFATEMVIRSTLLGVKIAEVPIVLHKDGRSHPPHLRTWSDGWRTLRLMMTLAAEAPSYSQRAPKAVMNKVEQIG